MKRVTTFIVDQKETCLLFICFDANTRLGNHNTSVGRLPETENLGINIFFSFFLSQCQQYELVYANDTKSSSLYTLKKCANTLDAYHLLRRRIQTLPLIFFSFY